MQKDMVHYSKNQGAKYATKAMMRKTFSLTQNMNIMHLKTKVLDSTHSTQQDQLKNAALKSMVRTKIDGTNA